MGYSKSFRQLEAKLEGKNLHPKIQTSYNHLVESATCCGIKELTQLEHLVALCEQLKLDIREQLALLLIHTNNLQYTLHYYNVDGNPMDMNTRTVLVLTTLKEFGFTEFTRFINTNYKYRGEYKQPLYTVGLELVPEFVYDEDEDIDEDNQ